jgi:hypothetical protein
VTEVIEYGIEWENPEDIQDSHSILGKGPEGKKRALYILELTGRLPGEMQGTLIARSIFTTEWRDEPDG